MTSRYKNRKCLIYRKKDSNLVHHLLMSVWTAFVLWDIVTRRTRGGSVNSKRWAVIFSCLSCRAVHIEVIEEMSTSSFINALRRFMAIRSKVKE
jgi:hypothetical protein